MSISTKGLNLTADSMVDLHLHTSFSDGSWWLETLFEHLIDEQFSLAAITDHDRADTAPAIQKLALEKHLPVLVAVEMSSTWKGELVDLLCYGFDPRHSALHDLAHNVLHRQRENTREVYTNLQQQGYTFSEDRLTTLLDLPSSRQPFAIIDLLKDHGYGLGNPSAGKLLLAAGCTFETNPPAAIVEAAHQSGAVCLLAHPGRGDGFVLYDDHLLDEFYQEVPVDGLEVYYPVHTSVQTAMYLEYARHHHLLVSAGSDSHKSERPPIQYRAELCRGLLERLSIQIA